MERLPATLKDPNKILMGNPTQICVLIGSAENGDPLAAGSTNKPTSDLFSSPNWGMNRSNIRLLM
jgi:hypothetical protein